jgi:NAD-dependent SIR2 family protein deacetylase
MDKPNSTPDPQLTEAEIRKCLEGIPDVITPEVQKEEDRAASSRCPVCFTVGGSLVVHPRQPHIPNGILPNLVVRCRQCQTIYDKSGQVVTTNPLSS